MDDNKKWDLVIRILSGEATPEEHAKMKTWLAADPENQEFYDEIKMIWDDAQASPPDYDREEVYQRLQNEIRRSGSVVTEVPLKPKYENVKKEFYWLKVAASWAFITLAAFSVYQFIDHNRMADQSQWMTATNNAGKRSKIFLPDSSIVWLNANSTLRFPERFPSGHRDVVLSGEAFFEVVKNARSPFTVTAGGLRTTVLGTSFNINSENEKEVVISVLTGKVRVSSVDESKKEQQLGLLTRNEQLIYNESDNSYQIKTLASAYDYASWKDGTLRFRNVNFEQIAQKLEHWYGMKIIFKDDAMRKCQLEGTFNNVPIEKVMKMLSITARFEYVIQGDSITVSGKGCY